MAAELTCWAKFTELVTDHVLANVNRHMAPAVVNGDSVTDKLREDGGRAGPSLEHFALALAVHLLNAL